MESVEQFLARGGAIKSVESGEQKITKDCVCGCKGRYAYHAQNAAFADQLMRDAENERGNYSAFWGQS